MPTSTASWILLVKISERSSDFDFVPMAPNSLVKAVIEPVTTVVRPCMAVMSAALGVV
ncbi:hypothetical protein D3C80_2218530 [compost metagenome]